MKVSDTVKGYLQTEGRSNVLATTDSEGRVNVATFGSFHLADDSTAIVMLGDNRSYENLQENPFAACMVTLHGKTGLAAQGCRLYLKVRSIEDSGETWEEVKGMVKARIGDAAEMLKHLVRFDIMEARPILDFGQGV
ncbi:MAG TPA: pyridoxamine 5'-phosphate oxidase family protein [Deltaproteobacteria bacterium]|nr:pyridoxamine 5'-phosphate oxidase family protein [Deltaproteobacteria bacterium]